MVGGKLWHLFALADLDAQVRAYVELRRDGGDVIEAVQRVYEAACALVDPV